MVFTRTWIFFFFLIPPLLAGLYAADFRRKNRLFKTLGDEIVLRRLTDPFHERFQRVKALFVVLASIIFVAALAGPRWGQKFQEVHRRGVDVMIAVDVSASMLAEDIAPNRLTQAKRELSLLIDGLQGDRVGLTAFAGAAFLQCPLTLDYGAAKSLLELIDPDLIPVPGTNIAAALDRAREAFGLKEKKHKALVLLTDGEDHSGRLEEAVKKSNDEGIRIFAVGFGNPRGEIIPLRDEYGNVKEYKKDKSGQTVVSKLNDAALRDMAAKTNGRYYPATQGEVEVEKLLADIQGMEKKNLENKVYGNLEDRYRGPTLAVLLLLLLEFIFPEVSGHFAEVVRDLRRRKKFHWKKTAAAAALFLLGAPLRAAGRFPSGEERAVAEARRAAEKSPEDPAAQMALGNALYRNKDFDGAAEAYENSFSKVSDFRLKSQIAYNAGNALFRRNKISEAVDKYKEALRFNPADPDAKHNLEFARRAAEAQKQKSRPDDKKDPGKNEEKNKDDRSDGDPGKEEKKSASAAEEGMTKEDAERLLQAVEEQEKEARRNQKNKPPQNQNVEEDW